MRCDDGSNVGVEAHHDLGPRRLHPWYSAHDLPVHPAGSACPGQ